MSVKFVVEVAVSMARVQEMAQQVLEFYKVRHGKGLLFMTQGDDGVDAGRAARGNGAGGECDQRKQERDGGIGERVRGRNAEYQAAKEPAEKGAEKKTSHNSGKSEFQTVRDDQGKNFSAACAEGHADSDFLFALSHGIGQDSIQTKHTQKQRSSRKKSEERRFGLLLRQRGAEHLRKRARIRRDQVRIDSEKFAVNGSGESKRFAVHANQP